MPLTPEDVVQKTFKDTKFREGYDQDEVDDFLDEVVGELRRLTTENEELRRQLSRCEGRVSELSGGAPVVSGAPAEDEASSATPVPVAAGSGSGTSDAASTAPAAAAAPAAPAAAAGQGDVAGMIALAQRLHDEHVREGEAQRDQLLAEAKETAARLVREAEETQTRTLGELEEQRTVLERTIDELRAFEREYRSRLKSYLENQLRDLDTKGQVVSATPTGGGDGDGGATAGFPFGGRR